MDGRCPTRCAPTTICRRWSRPRTPGFASAPASVSAASSRPGRTTSEPAVASRPARLRDRRHRSARGRLLHRRHHQPRHCPCRRWRSPCSRRSASAPTCAAFDISAACRRLHLRNVDRRLVHPRRPVQEGAGHRRLDPVACGRLVRSQHLRPVRRRRRRGTVRALGERGARPICRRTCSPDGTGRALPQHSGGGSAEPTTLATVEAKRHLVKMQGKPVFTHAVKNISAAAKTALEHNGKTAATSTWSSPTRPTCVSSRRWPSAWACRSTSSI